MRRSAWLSILTVSTIFVLAGAPAAQIPDPANCVVGDGMINTCPFAHSSDTSGGSERWIELRITLRDSSGQPVAGYPVAGLSVHALPHSGYPELGAGPGGDCPNCHLFHHLWTYDSFSNEDGEIRLWDDVDDFYYCAPSMCCPIEISVELVGIGMIPDPGEVRQNSFDLIRNGDVRAPDFGAFSSCYHGYVQAGILSPCCDFIVSGNETWGAVTGIDFAAFAYHYADCCGHRKEGDPANCDPFTDPCP